MQRMAAAALFAVGLLLPRLGAADDKVLTAERVAEIARERAPALVSARARIDEARGRLLWASAVLRSNPVVESSAGYRGGGNGPAAVEARIGIRQGLEIGGQRGARVAGAEAGIARATFLAEDAARRLVRDGAMAFHLVLYAQERHRLALAAEAVAAEVARVAERREKAGDASHLDINLARAALARAGSETRHADANRNAALGELRSILGLTAEAPLELRGDLRERRGHDLKDLEAQAARRADLRAMEAEGREARADRSLGEAMQWPDLGIGASFERTDSANVGLGTLSVTLPVFDLGFGVRAEASARERRIQGELEAARRGAIAEVRTGYVVFQQRVAAVVEYERSALPLLDQNEAQIRRSFELGRLPVVEFLALRREIIATRVEYLDRLLQAALAGIELEASAGARK